MDEARGLAVCLGPVGPCPDVFEAEDFAGGAEGAAFIAAALSVMTREMVTPRLA